jgi:hypothetical protein
MNIVRIFVKYSLAALMVVILSACDDAPDNADQSQQVFKDAYHEESIGDSVIMCSAVNSLQLSDEKLLSYQIESGSKVGVLSCVDPLAEEIKATHQTLSTAQQYVEMRRIEALTPATWIGTYPISTEYPIHFDITVVRADGNTVNFEFNTERM